MEVILADMPLVEIMVNTVDIVVATVVNPEHVRVITMMGVPQRDTAIEHTTIRNFYCLIGEQNVWAVHATTIFNDLQHAISQEATTLDINWHFMEINPAIQSV